MADSRGSRGRADRSYTSEAVKAAVHPTRQRILKRLQQGPASSVELEQETGENRYNLYHHLSSLEGAGLVSSVIRDSKTKVYRIVEPERPESAVLLATREEDPEKMEQLLDAIERVLEKPIPHRKQITQSTIMLAYEWTADEER